MKVVLFFSNSIEKAHYPDLRSIGFLNITKTTRKNHSPHTSKPNVASKCVRSTGFINDELTRKKHVGKFFVILDVMQFPLNVWTVYYMRNLLDKNRTSGETQKRFQTRTKCSC